MNQVLILMSEDGESYLLCLSFIVMGFNGHQCKQIQNKWTWTWEYLSNKFRRMQRERLSNWLRSLMNDFGCLHSFGHLHSLLLLIILIVHSYDWKLFSCFVLLLEFICEFLFLDLFIYQHDLLSWWCFEFCLESCLMFVVRRTGRMLNGCWP